MSPNRYEVPRPSYHERQKPFFSFAHELAEGESIDTLRQKFDVDLRVPAFRVWVVESNIEILKQKYQFARDKFQVGKTYVIFGRL